MVELFPLAKLISFLYVPMYASVCTLRSELQIIVKKLRGISTIIEIDAQKSQSGPIAWPSIYASGEHK